jgi:ACR3 family arsenite efflux pump ArsB
MPGTGRRSSCNPRKNSLIAWKSGDRRTTNKTTLFPDRYLTLGIFLAMAVGIGTGYFSSAVPALITGLSTWTTSIPIAIGLILMLYPPPAKVEYRAVVKIAFLVDRDN